jgi:hypothetical protein
LNLLGDNIDTIKRNTDTIIDTSKVVDLEINVGKTKYMLLSRHQNAGQNHDIKIVNRCSENVAQFKYLGTTATNQNLKNAVFWDVAPCRSCVNRRFGGTYRLSEDGGDSFLRNVGSHKIYTAPHPRRRYSS